MLKDLKVDPTAKTRYKDFLLALKGETIKGIHFADSSTVVTLLFESGYGLNLTIPEIGGVRTPLEVKEIINKKRFTLINLLEEMGEIEEASSPTNSSE